MQLRAITKLRIAFASLGIAVLSAQVWLVGAAEARVDAQRRARHEMVAERIFDELERELSSVIVQESNRAVGNIPANGAWSPFVIGYIQQADGQDQLVTRGPDKESKDDLPRLQTALATLHQRFGYLPKLKAPLAPQPAAGGEATTKRIVSAARKSAAPAQLRPNETSSSDVLKSLNRAKERNEFDSF
jgi:hypothetical protein